MMFNHDLPSPNGRHPGHGTDNPSPQAHEPLLSAEQIDQLRTLLALGVARSLAALYLGLSEDALTKEAQRDASLAETLARAQAVGEIRPLQQIAAAGDKHWQAAAWKLERTRPSRYARRKPDVFAASQVAHLFKRLQDIVFAYVPAPEDRARIEADLRRLAESMRIWGAEEGT